MGDKDKEEALLDTLETMVSAGPYGNTCLTPGEWSYATAVLVRISELCNQPSTKVRWEMWQGIGELTQEVYTEVV